jgi:hypothetical protein
MVVLLTAHRWLRRGLQQLPSVGTHITILGNFVHVSTLQHSHICYEIVQIPEDERIRFEQVFTDSRERSCTHHLVVDVEDVENNQSRQTVVLLTDKTSATVSGLSHPIDRTYKNASDTVFEACLPRTVIRLQRGHIRPPWRHPHSATHQNRVPGVIVDDIIGACSDGTIYAFSILSEPSRHLLRFLQNLIQAKEARSEARRLNLVKHRSGDIFNLLMNGTEGAQDTEIRARDIDPRYHDHALAAPRNKHVDGDVLLRFFAETGNFEELLSKGTSNDVAALFVELSKPLLETTHGGKDLVGPGLVHAFRTWLGDILLPLF